MDVASGLATPSVGFMAQQRGPHLGVLAWDVQVAGLTDIPASPGDSLEMQYLRPHPQSY